MATFLFTVKNGQIDFGSEYNQHRFDAHLKENEGKIFRIEKEITTRTMSQNKLYWLFLHIIERETGNSANDMHELFRRTLLPPVFIKVMNQEIKIPMSTTDLRKHEFAEYLDKISAKTGVAIPDTDEFMRLRDLAPMINE